jgi:tryptophan-rich sensory protein
LLAVNGDELLIAGVINKRLYICGGLDESRHWEVDPGPQRFLAHPTTGCWFQNVSFFSSRKPASASIIIITITTIIIVIIIVPLNLMCCRTPFHQ